MDGNLTLRLFQCQDQWLYMTSAYWSLPKHRNRKERILAYRHCNERLEHVPP